MQKRSARFVTGNYNDETGSMTGILGQLKRKSLKKRRKDNRLILLHKGLKGKASVPTDDLIPKTRRCRNQHSMATPGNVVKGQSNGYAKEILTVAARHELRFRQLCQQQGK